MQSFQKFGSFVWDSAQIKRTDLKKAAWFERYICVSCFSFIVALLTNNFFEYILQMWLYL